MSLSRASVSAVVNPPTVYILRCDPIRLLFARKVVEGLFGFGRGSGLRRIKKGFPAQSQKRNIMHTARLIFSIIVSAIVLAGSAAAQDAARSQQGPAVQSAAVVTASSTASGVRFVSPNDARRIRLEVYTQ